MQFNLRPWHLPRSSTASLATSLSGLVNRAFNVMAVSVGIIESATLGYPLRCTVQQLMKELRSSGNASSANIPMLTAPWRMSPFLTLPFYLLEELLHQEARLVSIQIHLVSDGKLSRIQRRKYRLLQSKILKYWEDYNSSEITACHLLKLCSFINSPTTRCWKPKLPRNSSFRRHWPP